MKARRRFMLAAAIILGITAFYWFVQGILSLSVQGNASQVIFQALVPAVIMALLLFLSWRRPLLGGILTAAFGAVMAVYFLMVKIDIYQAFYFLIPMCIPLFLSGFLFIEAEWAVKKNTI